MSNGKHLLVPVRVQALVIDDIVVNRKAILLENGQGKRVADDGKWSRAVRDYMPLINSLDAPDPQPFYGASRTAGGEPAASQLVLPSNSKALPRNEDRGVYLHWVLPPGLRHAYRPNSLDFPALPDQWLIVRFCRRGAEEQTTTRAWFLDGGLIVGSGSPANLLDAVGAEYVARRVGKVVPLAEFKPADFAGPRTTVPITAVGNRYTGSPTFTANIAENRNILSWHDSLEDLRGTGKIPKDVALTYLLLGWYRDAQDEPFAALPAQLKKDDSPDMPGALDVLKALGWKLDGEPPSDLSAHRCLFHGMVAHVNYWNPKTYKGTILGYPGAPPVEDTLSSAPPAFTVGVGNSAEDALVSLVSSEYTETSDKPDLWKALEAVIYRQPESLVGSWNAAPRDHTVHQSWFNTQEAGHVWTIRPKPRAEGTFPSATAAPTEVNSTPDRLAAAAAQLEVKPTPEQLAAVKILNGLQSRADATGRELSALQQDLYARWWKMCSETRARARANVEDEETDCARLAGRIEKLRDEHKLLLGQVRTQQALAAQLPDELELHSDPAPRFWTPADPFVVIKNCGTPTKHYFPNPLPCRLSGQTLNAAEVTVNRVPRRFDAAVGVTQLADSVRAQFAPRDEILTRLIGEASLVEQAVSDLVARSLLKESPLSDDRKWRKWTEGLVKDFTWDARSEDRRIRFGAANAPDVPPSMLAELWVRQPWSPLFIDWEISWLPTTNAGADFRPVWSLGKYDYEPKDRESIPKGGVTLTGRSMLSPVDGRIFDEPLKMLRELIAPLSEGDKQRGLNPAFHPAAAEILRNYEVIWDKELATLASAGMMGQVLSGFHQALLGRDVTLPRVMPDPARPWAPDAPSYQDAEVKSLLDTPAQDGPAGERLAPPAPGNPDLNFSLLRAGAFKLEELWLVDDFGQWADLLHGTSSGGSAGQVFNPRARWDNHPRVVAMPPRVVQPARLNFRFTETVDEDPAEGKADPALDSICGWIFYNPLDRALALCDRRGRLKGELVVVEEPGGFLVRWEAGPGGGRLDRLPNRPLRDFAAALEEPTLTEKPRLHELLALIERALERIRPAAARREAGLFGRPLALVSAQVGLELFGKAWTDPHWTDPQERPSATRPAGTGDPVLDALRVRLILGCRHNTEDGLVGYFKADDFKRIVPAQMPQEFKPSRYLAHPDDDAVHVGFGAPEPLTLLLDAWGSVQAAVGLLPAKSITLAHAELDKTLARMEASFRVGPVLLQPDRVALPTPVGDKGRWHFRGPSAADAPTPVAPPDPRYFGEQPPVAAEGRLLLLTSEE